jgi:hypothetical protein
MSEQAALSWDSRSALWQELVNSVPIPPVRAQTKAPDPVACLVRLVWERDGPELVQTVAIGWTARAVLVRMQDPRWRLGGAWVPAGDVHRPTG